MSAEEIERAQLHPAPRQPISGAPEHAPTTPSGPAGSGLVLSATATQADSPQSSRPSSRIASPPPQRRTAETNDNQPEPYADAEAPADIPDTSSGDREDVSSNDDGVSPALSTSLSDLGGDKENSAEAPLAEKSVCQPCVCRGSFSALLHYSTRCMLMAGVSA
jgi:hypothetical protein